MKKRIWGILFSLALVCVLLPMTAQAATVGLTTTTIDGKEYYEIEDADDLYAFAEYVNSKQQIAGMDTLDDTTDDVYSNSADAILTTDIVINPGSFFESGTYIPQNNEEVRVWTPIGLNCDDGSVCYQGTFDGNGHSVFGVYYRNDEADSAGFFGEIGAHSTVKNLNVKNSYIKGGLNIGGVLGDCYGTIVNCSFSGSVYATKLVGGVVGYINSAASAENCRNEGLVTGSESAVGGVVGGSRGAVINCHNTGTVKGGIRAGGVAGSLATPGSVENSYNTGGVSGSSTVGGVVGRSTVTITNCYNTGAVTGSSPTGDLVGDNYGTVTNCYYQNNTETEDGGKTAAQFASGSVCALVGYHSGGTATCTSVKICELCKEEYGERDLNNHASNNYTYTGNDDGSTHTKRHECCGAVADASEAHNYGETHRCVCGKMETFTVYLNGGYSLGLTTSVSTYGQDFVENITIPENTHLEIEGVSNKNTDTAIPYTYENGVLTIAADDIPAADIEIIYSHYVEAKYDANGGIIIPVEGYENDDGFAADGSYWILKILVGQDISPDNLNAVTREGYTFVDWRDASGKVYPESKLGGAVVVAATTDVVIYAQWDAIDYNVTISESIENGTVTADKEIANIGDTVTLTVTPAAGYLVDTITVTHSDGTITPTAAEGQKGQYTFTMPAADVTVMAAFVPCAHSSVEGKDNGDGTHDVICTICGVTTVEDAGHTQTCSVSEGVITASCSVCDAELGTAAVSASGKTYDGTAAAVTVAKSGIWENTDISVVCTKDGEPFTGEPVNAGTYTASITVDGKTASVEFTIAKAPLTLKADNKSAYVGDSEPEYTFTVTGLVSGHSVTGAVVDCAGADMTKAGTYSITVSAGDLVIKDGETDVTENYAITTANGTLTVSTPYIPPYIPPVSTPTTPPAENVTISGTDSSVKVEASIQGDKATVDEIDLSQPDATTDDDADTGTVTIDFSGVDSKQPVTTVEIPVDVVKQITEASSETGSAAEHLEVVMSDGMSIQFDAAALSEKAAQTGGSDIAISIEHHDDAELTHAQQSAVGERPAYDINVTSGGKHISDMGGKITVSAPYELKDGEKPGGLIVYYVDETGGRERCETRYDEKTKRVSWKTDHLSLYMIDYDETLAEVCDGGEGCPIRAFSDADPGAWYHDGVHYCMENGLMNGVADNLFAPGGAASRAMMVTILWRLEGEPVVNYLMQYEDVPAEMWYTEAVRWASSEKIVEGYDGKFNPDDAITREQLATILYRYEQYKGGGFKGMWMFLLDYPDRAEVSDWAYEAMCWTTMHGVVDGKPGGLLDPKGGATRAEAAAMLQRYCELATSED